MKGEPGGILTNYLTKFYTKYTSTISLNKNLRLSGSAGFIVAYVSTKYSSDDFASSTLTVIMGFISSKVIFIILFHLDNKEKYAKKLSGKLNIGILNVENRISMIS
jgi:hypothetical protein